MCVVFFADSSIYELSQPSDLLVHFPMWSVSQPLVNCDGTNELGQVQYEVEVPTDGSLTSYPHSPGSTGDHSDYSSGMPFMTFFYIFKKNLCSYFVNILLTDLCKLYLYYGVDTMRVQTSFILFFCNMNCFKILNCKLHFRYSQLQFCKFDTNY